jgi:NitT/TauT family transport system ATP-binding protein
MGGGEQETGHGVAKGAGVMTPLVVEAQGVGKTFGTGPEATEALRGIDLQVAPGDFVSLIGPSGCGKSTLLRLIGDLVTPTNGSLSINGKHPGQARLDRDYGIVFQSATLLDWRTVQKNVELPLEIMDFPDGERPKRAREMLELVQLAAFAGHFPWQLSGGMQQRVAIARALAFKPSLLLMDEPFGALDEMTRELMQQEVLRVWEETDTSVVFVTHSIPEAVFLSTRVVVMSPRPGRISAEVAVDLPRLRTQDTREDARYFELITRVREALRRGEQDGGGR